jgi:hypothetical protein
MRFHEIAITLCHDHAHGSPLSEFQPYELPDARASSFPSAKSLSHPDSAHSLPLAHSYPSQIFASRKGCDFHSLQSYQFHAKPHFPARSHFVPSTFFIFCLTSALR